MVIMKNLSVFLILTLLMGIMLSGCGGNENTVNSFSLAETPVADEKSFKLSESGTVSIDFEVPETGLIKMVAYDSTEYVEWPDEIAEIYVDFKDESGKIIYEKIRITDGYTDKYSLDSGKITADITVKNQPVRMERIALSWAFAADKHEPVSVDYETKAAAPADKNGVARFAFSVDKPSLVRIFPSEACIYESDCSFYIENSNGEKITGDISIHGTEWSSRLVFLTEGDYVIAVSGIEAVASCKVREEKAYSDIQLTDAESLSVPVTFGFDALSSGERKAKFTADGSKYLAVETLGVNTFYDSVHTVYVEITDADGNIVAQSDEEECISDETRIDISSLSGEYTVTVSASGPCVAALSLISE